MVPVTPFGHSTNSDALCWHWIDERDEAGSPTPSTAEIYQGLCSICKLFGAPYLTGRLCISDAYLVQPPAKAPLPRRDGVGIDRQRGAAALGAKYDFEYWDGDAFRAQVHLHNYELWQVGLLAHLLHALQEGAMTFGFGTRRGLGRMRARVRNNLQITYCGRLALTHLGPALPLIGLRQLTEDPYLQTFNLQDRSAVAITIETDKDVELRNTDAYSLRRIWAIEEPDTLWSRVEPMWTSTLVNQLAQATSVCGPRGDQWLNLHSVIYKAMSKWHNL